MRMVNFFLMSLLFKRRNNIFYHLGTYKQTIYKSVFTRGPTKQQFVTNRRKYHAVKFECSFLIKNSLTLTVYACGHINRYEQLELFNLLDLCFTIPWICMENKCALPALV